MNILFCGKWPPIQGGVCRESYEFVLSALSHGSSVTVVTNASSVEQNFKMAMFHPQDEALLTLSEYGGRFKLINIEDVPPWTHIPAAKVHLSQFIGALDQQIQRARPDALVGSYFEPYGLAAMIVGRIHGLPTFIRHAGSDLGRLASHQELHQAYSLGFSAREHVKVLTYDKVRTNELFKGLGLLPEQMLYLNEGGFDLPPYHLPGTLDVPGLLLSADEWLRHLPLPQDLTNKIRAINARPYVRQGPVIGIFGKAGQQKGSFDLANALASLAELGHEFTFLPMCSGQPRALSELYSIICSSEALARNTYILPPVALWHVPSYIKGCDALAFLENRFSVDFHTPGVPWEVISQGKLLIISRDQYRRISARAQLVEGKNCLVVDDPCESKDMRETLHRLFDTELRGALAHGGANLSKIFSSRSRMFKPKLMHPIYAAVTAAVGA